MIIARRVQLMGCCCSAGVWQILSTVTDELNRLRRTETMAYQPQRNYLGYTWSTTNTIPLKNARWKWFSRNITHYNITPHRESELVLPEQCRIQVTWIIVTLYSLHFPHKQCQRLRFGNRWCVLPQVLKVWNWKWANKSRQIPNAKSQFNRFIDSHLWSVYHFCFWLKDAKRWSLGTTSEAADRHWDARNRD